MTEPTDIGLDGLRGIVAAHGAVRRRAVLQPADGQGAVIQPPTYPGADGAPIHQYAMRVLPDGSRVRTVVVDQPGSAMNRLESLLCRLRREGRLRLPHIRLDLTEMPDPLRRDHVTHEELPHGVHDAFVRDALTADGTAWHASAVGRRMLAVSWGDATALFEHVPSTLLSGGWASHVLGGGQGNAFARALTVRTTGIDAEPQSRSGGKGALLREATSGLEFYRRAEVGSGDLTWTLDPKQARRNDRGKPEPLTGAAIGYGPLPPVVSSATGVSCLRIDREFTLSLATLRRYRFPAGDRAAEALRSEAAVLLLSALALLLETEAHFEGAPLRSGCHLLAEDPTAAFEAVGAGGASARFSLTPEGAAALYGAALENLLALGPDAAFTGFLPDEPLLLRPHPGAVEAHRRMSKSTASE